MSWKRSRFTYQWTLIALSLISAALIGLFVLREVFPEYMVYQKGYVRLEKFLADKEGRNPPPFKSRIKQIVIKNEAGPETIDRCVSCHVALDVPHFSPTRVVRNSQGQVIVDADGKALLEENPEYIFAQIEEELAALKDPKKLKQLQDKSEDQELARIEERVQFLESLLKVDWDGRSIDLRNVLQMHPLIGKETRPFELHPIAEYGCVVCHNGNGSGLVTDRAHGPVFDGEYEIHDGGPHPEFLDKDPENDPAFAHMFNHKPSHRLLFQTTPLYIGALMEAKCVQCHMENKIESEPISASVKLRKLEQKKNELLTQIDSDVKSSKNLSDYIELLRQYQETRDRSLLSQIPADELEEISRKGFIHYNAFLEERLSLIESIIEVKSERIQAIENELAALKSGETLNSTQLVKSVEPYLQNYQHGFKRFVSNACYACHKIELLSRGGVGPELTLEGKAYPWFVKESMVWPQADLTSSQMPNFHLDHEDLEVLMTFVMGQKGKRQMVSDVEYAIQVREWNQGALNEWEKPIPAYKIYNLQQGKTIFAKEGCASCHRIKGYTTSAELADQDRDWFFDTFDEQADGFDIIALVKEHQNRLLNGVTEKAEHDLVELLEEDPNLLYSYYTPFQFAKRARNYEFENQLDNAVSDEEKQSIEKDRRKWNQAIDLLLQLYTQEYGLGRLVAPRLNWSGIYRSDQWLMEHFRKPASHIPNSIMPVFPFDESKFQALTYFLNQVAKENRDTVRQRWQDNGFSPKEAYETHCAICHGEQRRGQGVIRPWIYPLPKNLRNGLFLQNLTKEKAIYSLVNGVKGTPMAPWGSVAEGKEGDPVLDRQQIEQLIDWIYEELPASEVLDKSEDVQKWDYQPDDILKELQKEESTPLSSMYNFHDLPFLVAAVELIEGGDFSELSNTNDLFDQQKTQINETRYMIKSSFYTEENIEAGRRLYHLHCAHCHGDQGGGNGQRAAAMVDAKPRYLTNIDWLNSRDDLRILQSLKYGVVGTSMSPIGAYTSMKQRIQLAIYVRTLAQERLLKARWASFVYEKHRPSIYALDETFASVTQQYNTLMKFSDKIQNQIKSALGQDANLNLSDLQEQQRQIASDIEQLDPTIQLYEKSKSLFLKRSEITQRLATSYFSVEQDPQALQNLLDLLSSYLPTISIAPNFLSQEISNSTNSFDSYVDNLKNESESLVKEIQRLQADIFSNEREVNLEKLETQRMAIEKFIVKLAKSKEEIQAINSQIQTLMNSYQQAQDSLRFNDARL